MVGNQWIITIVLHSILKHYSPKHIPNETFLLNLVFWYISLIQHFHHIDKDWEHPPSSLFLSHASPRSLIEDFHPTFPHESLTSSKISSFLLITLEPRIVLTAQYLSKCHCSVLHSVTQLYKIKVLSRAKRWSPSGVFHSASDSQLFSIIFLISKPKIKSFSNFSSVHKTKVLNHSLFFFNISTTLLVTPFCQPEVNRARSHSHS
jgi:hypothetical protein